MRKKILVGILVVSMLLPCAVLFAACNGTRTGSDLILTGGSRPQYQSLFTSDNLKLIKAAMSDDATEEQKNAAAIVLYDTANYSRKNTSLSLVLQKSNAGISMGDVVMHAFNLKSGDKWYYQLATQVSTGNDLMDNIMAAFAGFLKVGYTNGDGVYWYSEVMGSASNCDCTVESFPYASYVLTQEPTGYDEDSFKEKLHYLDSMHEINNMQFCAEILKDIKIAYDAEHGFYRVEFAVNMSADRDLITEWYAMAQKDMQVSGNSIKKYNYYEAVLEVWDNGYAKSFKSESSRDAGMASGDPVDEFTYLWVKDEIMELLQEDERIRFSSALDSPEEYIDYYSNPKTEAARLNQSIIGLIVTLSLIGAIIVLSIVTLITVKVLMKNGKLPKLVAKSEARKKKKLQKKAAKYAKKHPDDDNPYQIPEEVVIPTYLVDEVITSMDMSNESDGINKFADDVPDDK